MGEHEDKTSILVINTLVSLIHTKAEFCLGTKNEDFCVVVTQGLYEFTYVTF